MKMSSVPEICEMSMRADADRMSEVLSGPIKTCSSTQASDDPVMQIHYKSKKLREKQAKYQAKSTLLQHSSKQIQFDPMQLSDWKNIINQK